MFDWLGRLATSQQNDVHPITFEDSTTNRLCVGLLIDKYALLCKETIHEERSFAEQLRYWPEATRFALIYAQQEMPFADEQTIARTDVAFDTPYHTLCVEAIIQERSPRLNPQERVDDLIQRTMRRGGFSDSETEIDLEIVLESLLQKQFSATIKNNKQQGYGALRKYESFDQTPQVYEQPLSKNT